VRNHNWHIHLAHFIEAERERPFAWGQHDCCLFCADAAVIVCGVDPAEGYRGNYHDEASAYAILQELGARTIAGVWSNCFLTVPVKAMQRGDIALVQQKGFDHPASVLNFGGRLWGIAPGDQGLRTLPLSKALQAWRVE